MMDQNTCFAYLNMELPDDIRRLKEAGYYDAAIARIDACLACLLYTSPSPRDCS